MEKINVLVNGILDRIGSTTARNVRRSDDMVLMPVSVTTCGSYRKTSIDQKQIELIRPCDITIDCVKETNLLNYGRPDVIVDFAPDSFFQKAIPNYLDAKTSFVLLSDNKKVDLTKNIKHLGVNIALLPADSSEELVLRAIRFLFQKNEAGSFGTVFTLNDLAA